MVLSALLNIIEDLLIITKMF